MLRRRHPIPELEIASIFILGSLKAEGVLGHTNPQEEQKGNLDQGYFPIGRLIVDLRELNSSLNFRAG